MANLKRVEKRLETVEGWLKEFEKGTGPAQTMENLNWLVGQSRMLGDRLTQAEQAVGELQGVLQQNNEILQKFLEENDLVRTWEMYIESVQKEAQEKEDAVQEQETESLDVQEQAEDGEKVGE
tara:strand:- start:1863 stop:2231 length:369 start_codon:yes stop_codon:yes gene_type:complete